MGGTGGTKSMDKVGLFLRAKANVYHLYVCGGAGEKKAQLALEACSVPVS